MERKSQKRKLDYFRLLLYFYENPNCEICGKPSKDVHHIIFRSQGGQCESNNTISLCRDDHNRAHFKERPYLTVEDLWKIKNLNIEIMTEKYRLARRGGK